MTRSVVPVVALGLVWAMLGPFTAAQSEPFAGWDELLDDDYHFDSDERSLLGFSVRAPIDARSALDAAARSLAEGRSDMAAAQLLHIVRTHGDHVMQVAEGGDRWNSRWVGAGEWALYQLLTRLPQSSREQVLSRDEQAELARASAWHDTSSLARLAREHEGLPTGLPALADLARLQAEEGRFGEARASLARLRRFGGVEAAQRLSAVLPPSEAPAHEPFVLHDGATVDPSWPAGASADGHFLTVLARLTDRDSSRVNPFTASPDTFEAPYAPIVPVISDGVVYLCDTLSIWAQDLLSGRLLWHHRGPLEIIDAAYPLIDSFPIGVYANYGRRKAINPHQLAQPLLVGDRLLATVQVAERAHRLDEFDGYPINHPLPRRRLRALDRVSGEVLWQQERPLLPDKAFVNRFDVDGPVVSEGGVVFASGSVTEGAINAYVAAFDVRNGELLWSTPICSGQQELTMFNRPFQEHVISPPTLHEGSLYVCTNLGVVGCVDAWSGRVRWLAAYESIQRRSSRMVRPQNSRDVHWLNQPPLVIDDTLVVAPLDSAWVQGLDRRTGRRLFELSTQMSSSLRPPLRHQILDVGSGRFAVVNDDAVECFNASSGRFEWMSRPFGTYQELSGAALIDGEHLLVLAEPLLIALELERGTSVASLSLPPTPRGRTIQRVVPEGPVLVMTDGAATFAFVDHEAVRRGALAALGHDPRAALSLGELALAEQDVVAAAAHFERVLAADASRELRVRARSGRMEATLRAAMALDTPASWSRVLDVATTTRERFLHGETVLKALLRHGAEEQLVQWLAVLSEAEPQHQLSLDDDGPLPAALHYTLKRLPFESPLERVALLQQLVQSQDTVLWGGLPLADAAAGRIDELLARHGRSLYASFEAEAEASLARGATLDEIEERFPNALLVATQKVLLMEGLLEAGEHRRVFEEARDVSIPALVALRARAARAMGELSYADVLESSEAPATQELPGLPRDAEGMLRVVLADDRSLELHHATGRAAAEFAGTVLVSVSGSGAFLLLDTRTGQILWAGKPLPGGLREDSDNLDFHLHGELLLVRGGSTLQALALADGGLVWERTLAGRVHDVLPVSGLLVSLSESAGRFRVEGHGMATGARAFRIQLPEVEDASMVQAGEQLVCLTTEDFGRTGRGLGKRLLVLDLVRGVVASSTAMGDGFVIVNTVSDPATVLLSKRAGTGSSLMAFSPATAQVLWEHFVENTSEIRNRLFPTADDRLVLRLPAPAPGSESRKKDRDRLILVDALAGPREPGAELPLLQIVDPSAAFAPRVVLVDPEQPTRLQVLDGRDPARGYALQLEHPLPLTTPTLHHGRDGFVLLSSVYNSPVTTVVVVRGDRGNESFTVRIDDGDRRRRYQVELVEGAVVLARGGALRILRSSTP